MMSPALARGTILPTIASDVVATPSLPRTLHVTILCPVRSAATTIRHDLNPIGGRKYSHFPPPASPIAASPRLS